MTWPKDPEKLELAKKRMSESLKGRSAWNKGKTFSEETRQKMSNSRKGKEPWNKGKSGVYSKETLEVFSESKRGEKSIHWLGATAAIQKLTSIVGIGLIC